MKRILSLVSFLFIAALCNAQTVNWTWQGGSSSENQQGIYGTKGVANYNNTPNARQGSACWTDSAGNFWQFGGYGGYSPYSDNGVNYYFNDLWMYNPKTYEWTWEGGSDTINRAGVYGTMGVASATNWPGSRQGAVTFVDSTGTVWLFGGNGYDSSASYTVNTNNSYLNDLWKFNMKTMQWTWVSGSPSTNINGSYGRQNSATGGYPGGRTIATGSIDASGNLWLCSGLGFDQLSTSAGFLIDLWEFIPSTSSWIWISGSNQANQLGSYGTKGTGSTSNIPGSRQGAISFFDASGKFWLFGGSGYTGTTGDNDGNLNDLWNFNTSTHVWTWINGTDQGNQYGIYGKEGSYSSLNTPGGREGAYMWLDSAKNLWLYGGYGEDSAGGYGGSLGDLWEYSTSINQWAFVSGSTIKNQNGNYGIVGTPSTTKFPGSRSFGSSWKDNTNNLWFFGGYGAGITATSYQGYLSDVWEIAAPQNALAIKLIALQAALSGSNVLVSWKTASEVNNAYFNLQRSTDGIAFKTIDKVASAGSSVSIQRYNYTDANVPSLNATTLYYRLQSVDANGTGTYSKVIAIKLIPGAFTFTLSPNPVRDVLHIVANAGVTDAVIHITDMSGKNLYTVKHNFGAGEQFSIPVSQYVNNMLIVTINSANGKNEFKILKQ